MDDRTDRITCMLLFTITYHTKLDIFLVKWLSLIGHIDTIQHPVGGEHGIGGNEPVASAGVLEVGLQAEGQL